MAVLTSVEDVQPFLNRETVELDLERLQKSELLLIAEFADLEIRLTMNKQQVLERVREYLGYSKTEDQAVEDEQGSVNRFLIGGGNSEVEKLRLQLQLKQLECADKDKEREIEREKLREREKEREFEERQRKEKREV